MLLLAAMTTDTRCVVGGLACASVDKQEAVGVRVVQAQAVTARGHAPATAGRRHNGLCKSVDALFPGKLLPLDPSETTDGNDGRFSGQVDPDVPSGDPDNHATGSAHTHRWAPQGCSLPVQNNTDAARCYAHRKILVFSDSLQRALFYELESVNPYLRVVEKDYEFGRKHIPGNLIHATFKPNATTLGADAAGDGYLRWIRSRSVMHGVRMEVVDVQSNLRSRKAEIADADVIIISKALWDIGAFTCGVKPYYLGLRRELHFAKQHMKEGAQLYMWPLQWLAFESPRASKGFLERNSPSKIATYREASVLAASCAGVPTIDTVRLSRQLARFTRDGPHYYHNFHYIVRDLVLPMLCLPEAERLAPTPPGSCPPNAERAALDRLGPLGTFPESLNFACAPPFGNWTRHRLGPAIATRQAACTRAADLTPGQLDIVDVRTHEEHSSPWEPVWRTPQCVLRPSSTDDTTRCFKDHSILVLGSRQLQRMWYYEGNPNLHVARISRRDISLSLRGDEVLRWFNVGSWNNRFEPGKPDRGYPVWPKAKDVIARNKEAFDYADFVVLEGGYDDMASTSCGVDAYYEGLVESFRAVKKMANPGARLVAWAPHALHFSRRYRDPEYRRCMSAEKARVYREAFVLAASCAGIPRIETHVMTANMSQLTAGQADGMTYAAHLHAMYNDILVSVLCKNMEPLPPDTCDDSTVALARTAWRDLNLPTEPCPAGGADYGGENIRGTCRAP